MNTTDTAFFVTGGTLGPDARSYVERQADKDLLRWLGEGEFCYVLTSRQMGKSSLMVRSTSQLRARKLSVVVIDLTGIGLNVTPDQWYNGLLSRVGAQLRLEDELDAYWASHPQSSPLQRLIAALHEIVLPARPGPLVIFVDEIDAVRSLPFSTDEFFSAIRECYNRRSHDPEFGRLTFSLFGVATPSDLIRDARMTPFNIGRRVELTDFSRSEAAPLAARLSADPARAALLLERVLHWTGGHPYLTQRLLRETAEAAVGRDTSADEIDQVCEQVFLSSRAREQDDNLLFVRERLLRSEADLTKLLTLYDQVHHGDPVPDDDTSDLVNQLRLAGIVRVEAGLLRVRNRIYARVFDSAWVLANLPDATLEKPDGGKLRIHARCSIGRGSGNELVLSHPKVSRQHALIQAQKQHEYWIIDLGSSNGTFVNGHRVTQPTLLGNGDRIEVGPFRLLFRQASSALPEAGEMTTIGATMIA